MECATRRDHLAQRRNEERGPFFFHFFFSLCKFWQGRRVSDNYSALWRSCTIQTCSVSWKNKRNGRKRRARKHLAETSHRPTDALLSSLYFFVAVQFCFYRGLPSRSFFVLSLSLFSLIMVIRFSFALFNCRNFCFCWCCCCVYVCVIDNDGLDLLTRDAAAVVVVANGVGPSKPLDDVRRRQQQQRILGPGSANIILQSSLKAVLFVCVCTCVYVCLCSTPLCAAVARGALTHTHTHTVHYTQLAVLLRSLLIGNYRANTAAFLFFLS